MYSRITPTKSPSFCLTTLSASLTNITAVLPQLRDSGCYVSKPIVAPPPLWLQKHIDICADHFAQSSDLWHHPTMTWSWRLCGISPALLSTALFLMLKYTKCNLINVQQDAIYSVYYTSVGSSTCFGCWHKSSGARKTVITLTKMVESWRMHGFVRW